MSDSALRCKIVSPHARLPVRGSAQAAGVDVSTIQSAAIPPGERVLLSTGLILQFPRGYFGRLVSRSGLAKRGIDVCAGIIDPDYTDVTQVMLHNTNTHTWHIEQGDRIAQLLILPLSTHEIVEVDTIPDTERGMSGFGSSGR